MATPMFIVTGFLDSGKTTMIKETLMEQEWIGTGTYTVTSLRRRRRGVPGRIFKRKKHGITENR